MSLTVALLAGFVALPASANSAGVVGYTGKQNGSTCSACHSGGTAPTVVLDGPASLAAGGLGDYTLRITTTAKKGGGSVAATDGVRLTAAAGLKNSGAELVNEGAVNANAGEIVLTFRVTAPKTGTSFTLFAAGLSADGSGASGDGTAVTTKEITLGGDGGTTTPATSPPPAKQPPKPAPAVEEETEEGDEEDDRPRRPRPPPAPPGGCMTASGPVDGLAGLTILVLCVLRRRRRWLAVRDSMNG